VDKAVDVVEEEIKQKEHHLLHHLYLHKSTNNYRTALIIQYYFNKTREQESSGRCALQSDPRRPEKFR